METAKRVLQDPFGEQIVAVSEDKIVLNPSLADIISAASASVEALHGGSTTRPAGK